MTSTWTIEMAASIEDTSDNPESAVGIKDRNSIVQKCLTQLSSAHREVIDLVYYHEKSVDEVAQIVGRSARDREDAHVLCPQQDGGSAQAGRRQRALNKVPKRDKKRVDPFSSAV